jgi:MFS transporter, NNP family, nitrate/nitrite transporter
MVNNFIAKFKLFLKSGHAPTLFSAFLYFDFCFAVWVLNGVMGPYITEHFQLTPAQTGFMISVPIFSGALMRFPLGVLAQYIGRKNAAIVEMSTILLVCLYGYFFVSSYHEVLALGALLGIAGASFGVALSLGSGWYPRKYKGLAMGIAGAGNSGTALAALLAPPLATAYGWQSVYGFAALMMILPLVSVIVFAKEPPDRVDQNLKKHLQCLWQTDGWIFNLVYIITFGGFIGLSSFLPTYFYNQFHVTKIQAGQLTVLATLVGSGMRVFGGYLSDRYGGILVLKTVFLGTIAVLLSLSTEPSLGLTLILFMFCFAALGAGNGALFQLVPLRWPVTTAVAGSMIGEIGALGGSIIPNLMGQSKQHYGSFALGFVGFAILAFLVLLVVMAIQRKWVATWIGKTEKALLSEYPEFSGGLIPEAHSSRLDAQNP